MCGSGQRYASSAGFFDECRVVGRGVESKDAQLESVLTLGFAMAAARITSCLRENRQHVVTKGDRSRLVNLAHINGYSNRLAVISNDKLGVATGQRDDTTRDPGNPTNPSKSSFKP